MKMILGLALITSVALSAFSGCGGKSGSSSPAPVEQPDQKDKNSLSLTFAGDIGPIVAQKCAPCHSDGNHAPYFIGHEDVFQANGDSIYSAITSTDPNKVMPKPAKPRFLTDDEKGVLLAFLGKSDAGDRVALDFSADVNPILSAKCAPCHNSGNREPYFIGNESVFRSKADDIAAAITSTDPAKVMPKPAIQKTLSDDEKAKIKAFLKK